MTAATGRRTARARRWRVVVGQLILVLLSGCSTGHREPSPTPSPSPLVWAPPRCGDRTHTCVDLHLRDTGSHQTPALDENTDYRIHLPAGGPLVGGLTITSGRHVIIIGGQIDLSYPCSNDESACIGIYIAKASPGQVFVEGVWIRNPGQVPDRCPDAATRTSQPCSTGDGIAVNTTNNGRVNPNTITLQQIRVDGISGCSGQGDHSDVFQPYQAPNVTVRIHRMTGVTNCQGFTLDPDLAYSVWHTFPSSITVADANIVLSSNPYPGVTHGQVWWLTHGTGCRSGPLLLLNAYVSRPPGDGTPDVIWPDVADQACGVRYSRGVFTWTSPEIKGSIRVGRPAGGDFVPRGAVGLNYRSPGYR